MLQRFQRIRETDMRLKLTTLLLTFFLSSILWSETIYLTCKGSWEKKGTSKVAYKTIKIDESGSIFGELQILLMESNIAVKYSNKGAAKGVYMPDKCYANDTKVICNSGRKKIDNNSYYTHNLGFNYKDESFNFIMKTYGGGVDFVENHFGTCK